MAGMSNECDFHDKSHSSKQCKNDYRTHASTRSSGNEKQRRANLRKSRDKSIPELSSMHTGT